MNDEPKRIGDVITKEEYEKVKREYEASQSDRTPSFNKLFNMKRRRNMKNSNKKPDGILVFLLNLKKQIEGPILTKIYGGNFLVIRNHVYRYNPDRVFSFSKYKAVIAREFDRELVGIDDYTKLVMDDYLSKNPGQRVNFNDPVLIKAVIMARLAEKPQQKMSKTIWIILGVLVVAIIAGIVIFGKTTPAVVVIPSNVNTTG